MRTSAFTHIHTHLMETGGREVRSKVRDRQDRTMGCMSVAIRRDYLEGEMGPARVINRRED